MRTHKRNYIGNYIITRRRVWASSSITRHR